MASFSDGQDCDGKAVAIASTVPEASPSNAAQSTFARFTIELYLPVARFLDWHAACSFWSALRLKDASVGTETEAWRMLVATIVRDRGHDNNFLADLSMLREVQRYKPCGAAYQELFPEQVKHVFAHVYPPERILESIFAADDAALLHMVLSRQKQLHKPLNIDISKLLAAIDHGAKRCLQILLDASLKTSQDMHSSAVKINCPPWQKFSTGTEDDQHVDFSCFPMCLVWRAAATGDAATSDVVLCHLLLACGASCASHLRLWAACCGVACGNEKVLTYAGQALTSDKLSRVSFSCPQHGRAKGMHFEDAPLPVVAASCGNVAVLRSLLNKGVDFHLCNRRGLTVWGAAKRQPAGPQREALLQVLRAANLADVDRGDDSSAGDDPLQVVIEKGDLDGLRSLISRGARLEGSDIMSAVRSGDLDVLSFVQDECRKNAGTHLEYRKMVKATATQIRIESRARHSAPNLQACRDNPRELTPSRPHRLPSVGGRSSSRPSTPAHEAAGSRTSVLPPLRPDSRGSGRRPSSGHLSSSLQQAGESIAHLRQDQQRWNHRKLGR